MSLVMTLPAPITAPSPIVTPPLRTRQFSPVAGRSARVDKGGCHLQDGHVGTNPNVVANRNRLADAVLISRSVLGAEGMADAGDDAVGANVAALANRHVGDGRVHDHAAAVDKGRSADAHSQPVVDKERRLHKRRLRLEPGVAKRHVVCNGGVGVVGTIAPWADDAMQWSVMGRPEGRAQGTNSRKRRLLISPGESSGVSLKRRHACEHRSRAARKSSFPAGNATPMTDATSPPSSTKSILGEEV